MTNIPDDLSQLSIEIHRINEHKFIRYHNSWWRLFLYQMFRGLAFGFGSILGATVLISLFISLLGQMDFLPVIGNWIIQILDIIKKH